MPPSPMLASWLSYIYAPLRPLLERLYVVRSDERRYDPADILVPEGYRVELVAGGLNAPAHCCFGPDGACYVVETGHKIEAAPRVLRVDPASGAVETYFTLPEERWVFTGAVTGACWHGGRLYLMNTGELLRLGPDGAVETVVDGLRGFGDHQNNYPLVGPDGKIYFGQGTATNLGVVGADNYAIEWLRRFRDFHDVPARDIVLAGRNFEYRNVLGDVGETVRSGAYVPFGTETSPGQVIRGDVRCTGAILRCDPDGGGLEVVAWGLRNPYGLAFHPDGRLFATEHGSDERGQRQIVGDRDDLYAITEGAWYGWPDFASGVRLDDPAWGEGGRNREPVLAEFPDPSPPKPFVTFEDHAAVNGIDFSRDPAFGFVGDAFVALFGDLAPMTGRPAEARGFSVARVDMAARQVVDFAVNRVHGPASQLPHQGFERPSHCCFGPDGALYIVDYGRLAIVPEVGGVRSPLGSGALWRVRRAEGPAGAAPPPALRIRLHALQYGAAVAGGLALAGAAWALARRLLRRR